MMSRELGIRLYHLRKHKTIYSQRQVAELLHLDRSTYTKYENGQCEPSIETLKKLKEIFGVSYDELLGGELSEAEIADYGLFRKTIK